MEQKHKDDDQKVSSNSEILDRLRPELVFPHNVRGLRCSFKVKRFTMPLDFSLDLTTYGMFFHVTSSLISFLVLEDDISSYWFRVVVSLLFKLLLYFRLNLILLLVVRVHQIITPLNQISY